MRILADENCPRDLIDALVKANHDVVWVRADSPGAKDQDILQRAQEEGRVILTFDKDFGELAFRHRLPASSGIILCRLHGLPPSTLVGIVMAAMDSQTAWADSFCVITETRIRVVPLTR